MKKAEAAQVLNVLKAAYPYYYKNISADDAKSVLELYAGSFKDTPTQLVLVALRRYIDSNKYPPTIAGIREQLSYITGSNDYESLWDEAWRAICGNIRFEDLSPENKKYFGNASTLRQIGEDENTVMSVVKGQYMRRIGEICAAHEAKKTAKKALGADTLRKLLGDKYDSMYTLPASEKAHTDKELTEGD